VSYKEHKLILDTWGELVNDYLIQGRDVKLHNGLSLLGVRKKIKRRYIDRQESKRQGKLVFASNSHSDYFGAEVYWRRHYTTFGSVGWLFRPSRGLSRAVSAVMQQSGGHRRYVMRAQAANTDKPEQARALYNKKVLKL